MTTPHSGQVPTTNDYEMDDTKMKHDETLDGEVVAPVSNDQFDEVEGFAVDEAESRRVLRKIDWHLMPIMCVVYGLQFVSRAVRGDAVIERHHRFTPFIH